MPTSHYLDFARPVWMRGAHAQTIIPALYRRIHAESYHTLLIDTPDNDRVWADYYPSIMGNKLAILLHGLEGSSQRHYILSLANQLLACGWAVLAWNYRSCGLELNRALRFYHSGDTDDLHTVIQYVGRVYPQYTDVVVCGFSLGGNVTLKYLGERGHLLPGCIKAGVAISVPIDLAAGSKRLEQGINKVYTARFLQHLKAKVKAKAIRYPELDLRPLKRIQTLREFDDAYTAPLHGFINAAEYYSKSSSQYYLEGIRVPTLVLQANDDPMLPPSCFPSSFAEQASYVHLLQSTGGGHVGFVTQKGLHAPSFADTFVAQWLSQNC